jgi:formylglycine-generating enzyme required for sulfatase activity
MTESLVLAAGAVPLTGYTLVRLLGRGGFGEVWEARAPGNFHVALKFLRLEMREAAVEQRALEVICNIRHGHLLDVQFATRVADCLVIAMPLCDQSLLDRLNACRAEGRPGVPRNELLRYMDELARAVDYLNEPRHRSEDGSVVGIQHRDIKPGNIFLLGGSVRLADFGLAKMLSATMASTRGSMTPSYAAPEVVEGKFSRWSDQYALAATYCELRTGRPPFAGDNPLQIIYAHVHQTPELADIPGEERQAVARALAKKPEERWPTCHEFVRALIVGAREDDRRATAPAAAETKPPETQVPPPIPPTRIDDGSSSGVSPGVQAASGWLRSAVLLALPLLLVLLMAAVLIPRLLPSPAPTVSRAPAPAPPPPTVPAEPPETILPAPGPVAVVPTPVPVEPAKRKRVTPPPPPVEPTRASVGPPEQITNTIGMKLVLIPAGEFLMGSDKADGSAAPAAEQPQHRVRITRPFYLGATEVTRGQYRTVMGRDPSYFKGSDDLPVEQVSWNEAVAFCDKLNERESGSLDGWIYRLPTEAEWEYACRAGSTARYSFGNDAASLGEFAWYSSNSGYKTHPVGQKRPNAFHLFDMHGNVYEWCQDGYKSDYYRESPVADPPGLPGAWGRVIRGGSWNDGPRDARSAHRSRSAPENRDINLGIRVARARVQSGSR